MEFLYIIIKLSVVEVQALREMNRREKILNCTFTRFSTVKAWNAFSSRERIILKIEPKKISNGLKCRPSGLIRL